MAPPTYSYDATKVLQRVWAASGGQCEKYVAASMRTQLDGLERHGELALDGTGKLDRRGRYSPAVRAELLGMSAASIDRYLRTAKTTDRLRGTTTNQGRQHPLPSRTRPARRPESQQPTGRSTAAPLCQPVVRYQDRSADHPQAPPAVLAGWVHEHWSIENRLHWVRDVSYDEDRSHTRTGNSPHVMASLRNTAIGLLRLAGWDNIAAARRHHARDPDRAINCVLNC